MSIVNLPTQDPRPRLLWVDATPSSRRDGLARALAARGRLQQTDAAHLPARLAQGEWDLICFDFERPRIQDLELIAKTRSRWPATPILMLASDCSLETAVWALRARVSDLLIKPLAPPDIERCLRRVDKIGLRKRQTPPPQRQTASEPAHQPGPAEGPPAAITSIRLRRAIDYIARHHGRQLPETEVALVCEMSASWFCREFKAAFGVTYLEYLTRYRISQAKRLLGHPELSISDVAAAVGFTDPSYFTRLFRKTIGLSPTEYRESLPPGEHELSISATGTLSIPFYSGRARTS